jgi:excisionase family DNA binding protein
MTEATRHPLLDTDRESFGIKDVAHALGIGRSTLYRHVYQGDVPAIRIGSRILIKRQTVERMLNGELNVWS